MRLWVLCLLALMAWPAAAQDRAQTLADIKAELSNLMAEFDGLKAELVTTGATQVGAAGSDALQRLDAIEAELVRLTSKAEEVEFRLKRVVADGTNRIGDLEFRLCELTDGCDVATIPDTPVLGGGGEAAPVIAGQPAETGGVELAVSEKTDFDRAKTSFDQGDNQSAADQFATFAQNYPGGPLTQEAQFHRGEALEKLGDTAGAARAYLDAFSGKPDGSFAAESLLKLGQALGALGQVPDACVTLAEIGNRFPDTAHATNAQVSMQGLGCQ